MSSRLPVEKNGKMVMPELIEEIQEAEDKGKGNPMGKNQKIYF